MTKKHCTLWLTVVVAGVVWAGCNADGAGDDAGRPRADAGQPSASVDITDCSGTPAITSGATSGSEAIGAKGLINARLLDTNPGLPILISTPSMPNPADWTVQFTDADGKPLADVELIAACTYMPMHMHPGPLKKVTPMEEPGSFKLEGLRFTMPGNWEVQFALNSPSAATSATLADPTNCKSGGLPTPAGSELVKFLVCIPDE